jgi:hypothetical protein
MNIPAEKYKKSAQNRFYPRNPRSIRLSGKMTSA